MKKEDLPKYLAKIENEQQYVFTSKEYDAIVKEFGLNT